MQRLLNFFKTDRSTSKLENEITQLQMENESLARVLESEQAKNRELEQAMERKRIQLDHQIKMSEDMEKKAGLEQKIQEQAAKIEKLKKNNRLYQEGIKGYQKSAAHYGTNLDPDFMKAFLMKEKEERDKCRGKMLRYRSALQKTQEKADGDSKAWNLCEVCAFEFEDKPNRVPRVLACGHTICHSCVVQLTKDDPKYVQCPFDRLYTNMEGNIENLSKNLSILHQ